MLSILRNAPTVIGIALRYMLIARLAKACGDNVAVFEGAYLFDLKNLSIGSNVSIHPMCYISAAGGVLIGDNVSIAHASTIMSTEHTYSDPTCPTRDAEVKLARVVIGNDVWVGAGVRILAGVEIGAHAVIGAGSVVTRNIPTGTVAVGVPASPIRTTPR